MDLNLRSYLCYHITAKMDSNLNVNHKVDLEDRHRLEDIEMTLLMMAEVSLVQLVINKPQVVIINLVNIDILDMAVRQSSL